MVRTLIGKLISWDLLFLSGLLALYIFWRWNQHSKRFVCAPRYHPCSTKLLANRDDQFDNFDNGISHEDGDLLIPSLVHFVRVGSEEEELSPEHAACIFTALKSQPRSTVMLHTDSDGPSGPAWTLLQKELGGTARRLQVVRRARSGHVFGMPFRDQQQQQRVTALRVLKKYGGVFLSNDAYLLRDLSPFQWYECAAAPTPDDQAFVDGRVILAHRNSRLLRRWLHSLHRVDASDDLPLEPRLCRLITGDPVFADFSAAAVVSHPVVEKFRAR